MSRADQGVDFQPIPVLYFDIDDKTLEILLLEAKVKMQERYIAELEGMVWSSI